MTRGAYMTMGEELWAVTIPLKKMFLLLQPHEISVAPQGGWDFILPIQIHDRMSMGPIVCR